MPRAKQVRIVNGDQEGYCLEESVAAWERNGWTRADDEGSEEEAAEVTERPLETQIEQDNAEGGQVVEPAAEAPVAKKTATRKA